MASSTNAQPSLTQKLAVLGRMAWILKPYFLSHHPVCSPFDDHVLKVGPIRICQGCFFMYSGLLICIIAWITSRIPTLNWLNALILALLLFIPTLFHILIGLRFRFLKMISRLMLGGTIFFSLYSILSLEGIFRIFTVPALLWFFGLYALLGNLRMQQEFTKCSESCPFGEKLPACSGLRGSISKLIAIKGLKDTFPYFYQNLNVQFQEAQAH
ncbi:MAG: hypothetical protein ACFFB3_15025 [Candidatus Hodarchaeota archaeon]